jgi:hypothetical protein
LAEQLNDLVELVRQPLSKHAKDVVDKLVQTNVTDIGSFEWISQLRYYW